MEFNLSLPLSKCCIWRSFSTVAPIWLPSCIGDHATKQTSNVSPGVAAFSNYRWSLTNQVHITFRRGVPLHDVLTAVRHHTTVANLGPRDLRTANTI